MQTLKELRLQEYNDFLEKRVDSLEQEVEDLETILTMIFESEEETTTRYTVRFCTCDLDDEEEGDEDEGDDEDEEDDDDWY